MATTVKIVGRKRRSLFPRVVRESPALIRVVPFALFLVLTFCQDVHFFGGEARYWFYLAKTLVGVWMVWEMWPLVEEMRWKLSFAGIFGGIVGFAIWVWLDDLVRLMGINPGFLKLKLSGAPWNPHEQFAPNLANMFIATRILGSTLLVPMLEEVFFRSFLYRYIAKKDFERVPVGQFLWVPFVVTSVIFGFEHREWLAGILCGLLFQWLVCWKKRLGDAILAHAITNLLLGIWVVWKDEWHFW
jgi:CAAX prenyl protease-like protein